MSTCLDRGALTDVYLANVADVVRNNRNAGVRRFVLAGAVPTREEVRALEGAAAVPLLVVRLEVERNEIERRLQADPLTGRREDLRIATQWLDASVGVGIEDITVSNEGAVQDVARHTLEWLEWTS